MWGQRAGQTFSLNGTWKFNPDPYTRCKQQKWWLGEGKPDSFFPCWDMDGLWDIEVPGTWKAQFKSLEWYDGEANYVRDFVVPEDLCTPGQGTQRSFLKFDGVGYSCDIYLNGEKVGSHNRGYSPFVIDVSDHLKTGPSVEERTNRIFVLVENHLSADRVPGVRFDWNNDGGIINAVNLLVLPGKASSRIIENFKVETSLSMDKDEVLIEVDVWIEQSSEQNPSSVPVKVHIPELGVSAEANTPPTTTRRAHLSLVVPRSKVTLWSPEHPKLYRIEVSSGDDEAGDSVFDDVGLRQIETSGTSILLNKTPIRLYGVSVHSEFLATGRTATPEGIEAMLIKVKALGCNFIRCAHYPYAEIFGRAMDRAGIMWWEEVPVYWLSWVHKPPQLDIATGMLQEMVTRDWNRASLIIWSVSNECAGAGDGQATESNYGYWETAVPLVKKMDRTRLISSADHGHRKTSRRERLPEDGDLFDEDDIRNEKWTAGHPQSFYDLFDVLSGNVYVSHIGDGKVAYHKFAEMLRHLDKPLVVSEFGSMSVPAKANESIPDDKLGSEARHEVILREAFQSFHELPEIVGWTPWCLMDVRVPMHWRWYNRGKGVFRYGLLDEAWKPKRAFAVVQEEIARLKLTFG